MNAGKTTTLLQSSHNYVERGMNTLLLKPKIDDREGGPGTHLGGLSDAGDNGDDVILVDLPFTFSFYGQEYDQISVCSNGRKHVKN